MQQQATEEFRLSPQQQRLWELQRDSRAYRSQAAMLITGPLDEAALKEALRQAVARHEILRTGFQQPHLLNTALQIVFDDSPVEYQQANLSGLSAERQAAWLDELFDAQQSVEFDLATGRLLQVTLVKMAAMRHVLLLSLPALCADVHSLQNLAGEIVTDPDIGNHEGGFDGALIQYADYAEWQSELLAAEDAQDGRRYWRNLKPTGFAPSRMPFEEARASAGGFDPKVVAFSMDATVVDAIESATGAPAAAFFLACWQALLSRLSGSPDVMVGVISDGRSYADLNRSVGLFARCLPVYGRLRPEARFSDALDEASAALREAGSWQDYFTLRELGAADSTPAEPVPFPYIFDYRDLARVYSNGQLSVSLCKCYGCFERFKIQLSCTRHTDSLSVELAYDPAYFAPESIEEVGEHFRALIGNALARLDAPIAELDLLSARQRQQWLVEFNSTVSEYDQSECVHHLIERQARLAPDRIAVEFDGARWSYAPLNERANQIAHSLVAMGVGTETIVAIHMPRCFEMVAAALGILKAGAAYLPLDLAYPPRRLSWMIDDAGASVILTLKSLLASLPDCSATRLCADADSPLGARQCRRDPVSRAASDNLAYVIYTSGSTGKPKGVMIPHRGLVNYLTWAAAAYRITDGAGTLVHSPLAFDLTVTSLLLPLVSGQAVELLAEDEVVESLSQRLRSGRDYSLVKLTPTHLDILTQLLSADAAAPRPRALIIGGEALKQESLSYWREHAAATRLINEYGPTETVVGCCVYQASPEERAAGHVPIGRPIANTRLYLLDEHQRPVPQSVAGEMYIGGDGVGRGYLARPDLTAAQFVPDPFGPGPGARLYKTGDLCRRLSDGNLDFIGRKDTQVKVRGFRIELAEVEATIRQHPAITDAVVLARNGVGVDHRLVGYVVCRAGQDASGQEMSAFLKASLPDYMVPTTFVNMKSFPITVNGKIDKEKLPAPGDGDAGPGRNYVAPRTDEETVLAEIWADVLGRPRVGVDDNFFSLGGDSILGIRIRYRAEKAGLRFSTQQFFENPTISALASLASRAERADAWAVASESFSLIAPEDRAALPDGVEDAYPLTMLQAGMIFHSIYGSEWAVYYDLATYRLRGPLEIDALKTALARLLERHPVLRTSFDLTGYRESLQLVHQHVPLPLEVEDLRGYGLEAQAVLINEWLQAEKARKFDWSAPPLLRVKVHRRSDETFQLTISKDHAILDGWSNALMMVELLATYSAIITSGGEPPQAAAPAAAFRDYVALERQALKSERDREFWTDKLSDSSITKLPRLMASRKLAGPQQVRAVDVPIALEVSEKLSDLARSASVSLKSVVLAAHVRVLSLLSGQLDVVTGMIAHGRPEEADGDRVLGLFLNALPLRVRLSGGTWSELVRQVFEAEQEAFPFRRFPLAEMQRLNGGQPLFEASFNFNHFHIYGTVAGIGGLELLDYDVFEENSFVLTAQFSQDPATARLHLTLRCNMRELSEAQVEALRQYYTAALTGLADRPFDRYDQDALLSPSERRQLLVEWNDSRRDYPESGSAHGWFETQVERTPDALALSCEGASLTYAELNRSANRLAHRLRRLGVVAGTTVGLCLERSLESLVGLLAILKAGGAYVPLDANYPSERLGFMLGDAGVSVLLTSSHFASRFPSGSYQAVYLDEVWSGLSAESGANPAHQTAGEEMAYVLYTSGSTGQPKGVAVEHRHVVNYTRGFVERVALTPGASFAMVQPLTVDAVGGVIFPVFFTGGHLHVILQQRATDPEALADYFQRCAVECLKLAPSHLAALQSSLANPRAVMPLRRLIVGGEASDWDWLRRLKSLAPDCVIVNHYGPTEATVGVLTHQVEAGDDGWNFVNAPLGRPLANTQTHILDGFFQPAAVGVPGELYIGGRNVARGYLRRPELTARTFVPDPFGGSAGARLYKTGDLARRLPDGVIEFLGRADHQVKLRGHRIEMGEIQATLDRHPLVQDALVVAREVAGGEKSIVAYLVPDKAQAPTVDELRQSLKQSLPEYMIPSHFVMLEALPLSPHGKVDLKALPPPGVKRRDTEAGFEAPQTEVERLIARLWQDALQLESVGVHESFFDLGGHSLSIIRVHSKLKEVLGRDVPLLEMFNNPTIHSLAKFLSRPQATPTTAQESRTRAEGRREASQRHRESRQRRLSTQQTGVQDE